MASNAELQAEIDRLNAENDELATQLEEAEKRATVLPNTKPVPVEPSFGLTEGNREELDRLGRTVSPFTGKRLIKGDNGQVREATAEEFTEHARRNPGV